MKTLIAGGGVGGLTTALSLHSAGLDSVDIVEAAPSIKPLGVGINVLPHAIRELDELGLSDQVRDVGLSVDQTLYYDQYGSEIAAVDRGTQAGYAWPQLSMHRGALQMMLLEAVTDELGDDVVRTGTALRGFDSTDSAVTATVESTTGTSSSSYDLLVGADGINSSVRAALYPQEGDPEWNHCLMFRGVARLDHDFLHRRSVLFAGHHDQRFMLYPIKDPNGELILNWGCTIRVDGPLLEHSNWNQKVDAAPLLDLYQGWRCGSVDVVEIISSADEVFQYPMTDRNPLPQWSFDRATLLGDAAHPMYPSGSNGTSQAILDARILAQELTRGDDVLTALSRYEQRRLPATAEVIRANRSMADMRVLQVVHERAPRGFGDITDVISATELHELMSTYQRTAGFDPEQLNSRESLTAR